VAGAAQRKCSYGELWIDHSTGPPWLPYHYAGAGDRPLADVPDKGPDIRAGRSTWRTPGSRPTLIMFPGHLARPQASAAYRQKSCIRAGAVGPVISSWLSRMLTAPVEGVICAAVPVPPTQP